MNIKEFYLQAWRYSVASPTGRRIWLILLIKVAILLVLFKVLFFRDALADYTETQKSEIVRQNLTSK